MISIENELLAKELEKLNILIIPKNIAVYNSENQIIELYLSRYGIKTIPKDFFSNKIFAHIQKLFLNSNKIVSLGDDLFSPLKELKYLNVGRNFITKISKKTFLNLQLLQELDLSNNKISFIEEQSLDDLLSLEIFNLKNNFLEDIDDQLFSKLSKLRSLNLGINKFRFVPRSLFYLYNNNLEFLNLNGNYLPSELSKTFKNSKVSRSFISELNEFWKKDNSELNIPDIDTIIRQYLFDSLMSVYHYSVNVPVLNYSLLGIMLGYMAKNFHLLVNYFSTLSHELTFQEIITLWYNVISLFDKTIEKALLEILDESEMQNERQRRILERKEKMLSELEKEIEQSGGLMDYAFKKTPIEELEIEPIHENLFNLIKQFMDWNRPNLSTIFL